MRLTLCEAPTRETRPDHNTGKFMHYSLQEVHGFYNIYHPYPRRLESLLQMSLQQGWQNIFPTGDWLVTWSGGGGGGGLTSDLKWGGGGGLTSDLKWGGGGLTSDLKWGGVGDWLVTWSGGGGWGTD